MDSGGQGERRSSVSKTYAYVTGLEMCRHFDERMVSNMYVVVLLTLPLFTMRLLSEEKRMRTDQALMTAPVSLNGIVAGKFFAAYTLFVLGVSVCVIYFAVLSSFSSALWSIFLGNFLGLLLLGASLLAIGDRKSVV